ncbi:sortase [Candidatus Dojkabacteria bacterium]|jgi:sortase A|uniref:Sortase n=1 Tax=Candidatus Dojkabacteria bacterium TaxID=2099670 RepID=A0A955L1E6_9BACT|nr:sortase [Candidatus Dojkabacteria bacterium]
MAIMKKVTIKRQSKLNRNLPRINKILSFILFFLSIYIMISPFIPELELLLNRQQDETQGFVYKSTSAEVAGVDEEKLKPIPKENRVVIPAINVDAEILEGETIDVLNEGQAWRRPLTSSPEKSGNTVVVGHRYFGQGKNTFYHLNKLTSGEEIIVFWEEKEYKYKIERVYETNPEDISVEASTNEDILTLYTCSGLSAEKRLIVVAKPVTES